MRARWVWVAALAWAACGGEIEVPDAGIDAGTEPMADAGRLCEQQLDCDDGVHCNGREECADNACRSGAPPCAADQECLEAERMCRTLDCLGEAADRDGDMHRSMACRGDDCDDEDGARYPGLAEVCDPAGHDEDCNPSTVGPTDEDDDGAVSDACCNGEECGPDCDDADPSVRTGATEACDDIDNDCDGSVDEALPLMRCYRDEDGDGYGVTGDSEMRCACGSGLANLPGDCHDGNVRVHPGVDWTVSTYCLPGQPACIAGGPGSSGDWNCDGTAERRYLGTLFVCAPGGSGRCTPSVIWEDGSAPACGVAEVARICNADCSSDRRFTGQECR